MALPIKQAEGFAIANGLTQVIIFGHDGKETHVLTWGDTAEHGAQAAAGANAIKKKWGWPDEMQAESAKVQALRDELAACRRDLEAALRLNAAPTVTPTVHVIEGTEYERGWGQRPDGYVAFLSKEAAEAWMADYIKRNHTSKEAPDEYTSYTYVGIRECSMSFFNAVSTAKLKHFDRTSELK